MGADSLGALPRLKEKLGIDEVIHWDGRLRRPPKALPKRVDTVVIFTGFISHTAMHAVKRMARMRDVRIMYLKRGLTELETAKSTGG